MTTITAHTEEDNMPKPQNGLKLKLGTLSNYEVEWSDQLNATPRDGMMYLCHFLAEFINQTSNKFFLDEMGGI
ncbi:MAG: hypothetical protein EOL87_09665 [Spartobacteria bacterium]|nr:hypothetical protein [Spartobacteria bacterium]